jgi:hypothetical protein
MRPSRRVKIVLIAATFAVVGLSNRTDATNRTWVGGFGGPWNEAARWSPAGVPTLADDVTIDTGTGSDIETVFLTANGLANSLFMTSGAHLSTGAHGFFCDFTLSAAGTNTEVFADTGGLIDATSIALTTAARLNLAGGSVTLSNTLSVASGTQVRGRGLVQFSGAGSLNNNGSIFTENGNLTIERTATGSFNLDGIGENGIVNVTGTSSDLILNGPLSDDFDGTITITSDNTAFFNSGWTLGTGGVLNLDGVGLLDQVATVSGVSTIKGQINVNTGAGSGDGRFSGAQTFTSTANVAVAADNRLILSGATTYQGGAYTGLGVIMQNGNATIASNTVMSVATYDWDGGNIFASSTTVNPGVTLTINSDEIDTLDSMDDGYDGILTLNGGRITVNTNTAWRLDGTMNMSQSGAFLPTVNAGQMMRAFGTINVTGIADINSAVEFDGGTVGIAAAASNLNLNGLTTYRGGTFSGAGKLTQNGNATVRTATTIDVDTFDWDGIEDGTPESFQVFAPLTINSNAIDTSAADGFDDNLSVIGSSLVVNTGAPWRLDGSMTLTFASPNIAQVGGQQIIVNGAIHAGGGGASIINAPVDFQNSASVDVPAGNALELQGPTIFRGGSYTGAGQVQQDGNVTVAANTTIGFAIYDWDGFPDAPGHTTTINPGITFTLNVQQIGVSPADGYSGTVTLADGSVLAVNTPAPWTLDGTMNLNDTATPGQPIVVGSVINLSGTINTTGSPLIAAAGLNNNGGTINTAAGGTALVSNTFSSSSGATLHKTGGGSLTIVGPQNHALNSRLSIAGGSVQFNTDAGAGAAGANLIVDVNGAGATMTFASTQHLANLVIGAGGYANLTPLGNKLLVTRGLSIAGSTNAWTGKLNLNDNDLVLDYPGGNPTPLPTIVNQIRTARNNGAWNGNGITSSAAAAANPAATTLGAIEAADYLAIYGPAATFSGQTIDNSAVLVKYTWYGDSDFNGKVNFDDYVRIDNGFNSHLSGWTNGDFDLNGVVNFDDYVLIDLAFNVQSGTLRRAPELVDHGADGIVGPDAPALRSVREHARQFGADYAQAFIAAVPDPACATALFIASLAHGSMRRRRRVISP